MNFVFGLIPLAVYVPLMIGGYYLLRKISADVLDETQSSDAERLRFWALRGYKIVAVIVGVMIVLSSFQTFGPRNSLSAHTATYHPEAQEVQGGEDFTQTPEWRGRFDEKLQEEVVKD